MLHNINTIECRGTLIEVSIRFYSQVNEFVSGTLISRVDSPGRARRPVSREAEPHNS